MTQKFSPRIRLLIAGALLAAAVTPGTAAAADVRAVIETSAGTIDVRLDPARAPITVKNFIDYAEKGFYENLTFHRVIDGFMIQGGGYSADMKYKAAGAPIVNEARGGLPNRRGTIAMARTSEPHSATSQFYINVADNDFLNADRARDGWGYTVFGYVVKGMDVVDRIASARTTTKKGMRDVPVDPVLIYSVKITR